MSSKDLTASLSALKITPPTQPPLKKSQKPKPVADSWEDESLGSSSDSDSVPSPTSTTSPSASSQHHSTRTTRNHSSSNASSILSPTVNGPAPPPPTPASPSQPDLSFPTLSETSFRGPAGVSAQSSVPERRPDKTTAVASRMIAAGIGMRAPRRTEEEREYDRAMREKERKRRDREREEKKREEEERERARRSVWED